MQLNFESAGRLKEINEKMELLRQEADAVRSEVVKEILAAMKEFGIQPSDLGVACGAAPVRTGRVGAPRGRRPAKYANPNGPETWTGAGRRPAWFNKAIEDGIKEEDMLIKTTKFE